MNKVVILLSVITSFTVTAQANDSVIKPVPFISLKNNSEQYASICRANGVKCTDKTKVWKEKEAGDVFYLTGPSLELIKIRSVQGAYIKQGQWDFSEYHDNGSSPDDELTKEDVYIYPALYPLNNTRQAVALVTKWSTGYSGGGRSAEYADFLMLNDDGSYRTAFKNISFFSSEMIRACFSEEDYAKKSHCHDESWSTLSLKFIDEGKAYYTWKFITKSSDWPSFTERSSATVETREQVAYPFQSEAP